MRDSFCFAFHQTWGCLDGLEVNQVPRGSHQISGFLYHLSSYFWGHRQKDHEMLLSRCMKVTFEGCHHWGSPGA